MAVLKVYQPQIAPQATSVPNESGLTLPLSLATDMSSHLGGLSKIIGEIYKEQKDNEDQNALFKIVTDISPEISAMTTDAAKNTDVKTGVEQYTKAIKDADFINRYPDVSTAVKNKFQDWVIKHQYTTIPQITAQISKNSIETSQINNDKYLTDLNLRRSSSNIIDRNTADKEYENWFTNPVNIKNYGVKELDTLRKQKDDQRIEFQILYNTKNAPMSVLENADQINATFGEQKGKLYLDKARSALVSQQNDAQRLTEHQDRATVENQIGTFSEMFNRINNYNSDKSNQKYVKELPSLDFLNDLKKNNQINSVQYETLLQTWNGKERLTDDKMLSAINAQIAVAKTVDQIDIIREAVNLNPDVARRLNVRDINALNTIFEQHKKNREGFQQDQYYRQLLESDLRDVKNLVTLNFGDTEVEKKSKALQGEKTYNDLVAGGMSPEKAYIKTIQTIDKQNIPTLKILPKPETVQIDQINFQKDPKKEMEDLRVFLSGRYKAGSINIEQFKQDLSRLDVIDQVYDVRNKLNMTNNFTSTGNSTLSEKKGSAAAQIGRLN